MKKRTNKGMALATTLIMMTIILMMSTIMMSVTLYGAQVSRLQTRNVDDRIALDEIGYMFLNYTNSPDEFLVTLKEETGMTYIDGAGDDVPGAEAPVLSNGAKAIKGNIDGIKGGVIVKVKENANTLTLTVTNTSTARPKQYMEIICAKTANARTGEITVALKSWEYAG